MSIWFDRTIDYGLYNFLYLPHYNEITDFTQILDGRVAREVASLAKRRMRQVAKSQDNSRIKSQMAAIAPFEKKEIRLGRLLGRGGFSTVYEISSIELEKNVERRMNGEQRTARELLSSRALKTAKDHYRNENFTISRYAMKHIYPGLIGNPEKFSKAAMDLAIEAQMLLYLDHPHIIKLRGLSALGTSAFKAGTHDDFFLVMDRLLETLEDRIYAWRHAWKRHNRIKVGKNINKMKRYLLCLPDEFEEKELKLLMLSRFSISFDISNAIKYLHDHRIICRDIKTSNIGFDIHGDVKMFDFGLSRFLPEGEGDIDETFLMSTVGTRTYMAPEVSQRLPYNQSADVYSFGVLLWEIFSLSSPRREELYKRLLPCDCWPSDLIDLVPSMLDFDPRNRPGMSEVTENLQCVLSTICGPELSGEK
jgi:serine/threonine protein kinase